jgi:SAM-dependent methyltransferase
VENLTSCPVCFGQEKADILSCKDFVATGETFKIVECKNCGLRYTNPRPSELEIGKYYQSDKYISHSGTEKKNLGFMYKVYDIVRNFSIKSKLNIIKRYNQEGTLLDLGCGMGYFAKGVKNDNTFKLLAADVSDEAIRYVKDTFNIDVMNESNLDEIAPESLSVITQWHVLEHVHRLDERMKFLKRVLNKNGTMFIAVPIYESFDAEYYKSFWDGYDVPRHLLHFSTQSMNHLMSRSGFKIVKEIPFKFDAPYISMRSEIHQGNKLTMLKGATIGSISNLKALFNKKYSTILFVVKHA